MRLPTDPEMTIFVLLLGARGQEMYGLEMVHKDNSHTLTENSIYMILTRMIARGYLMARYETAEEQKVRGPKRRLYSITDYGKQMYDARCDAERRIARAGIPKPQGAL